MTIGEISLASFGTAIDASVGIASASFSLGFSMCTGIFKTIFENNRK